MTRVASLYLPHLAIERLRRRSGRARCLSQGLRYASLSTMTRCLLGATGRRLASRCALGAARRCACNGGGAGSGTAAAPATADARTGSPVRGGGPSVQTLQRTGPAQGSIRASTCVEPRADGIGRADRTATGHRRRLPGGDGARTDPGHGGDAGAGADPGSRHPPRRRGGRYGVAGGFGAACRAPLDTDRRGQRIGRAVAGPERRRTFCTAAKTRFCQRLVGSADVSA